MIKPSNLCSKHYLTVGSAVAKMFIIKIMHLGWPLGSCTETSELQKSWSPGIPMAKLDYAIRKIPLVPHLPVTFTQIQVDDGWMDIFFTVVSIFYIHPPSSVSSRPGSRGSQQDNIIHKNRLWNSGAPKPDTLRPMAAHRIPIYKNNDQDQWQRAALPEQMIEFYEKKLTLTIISSSI